jgi:hypothetical protein
MIQIMFRLRCNGCSAFYGDHPRTFINILYRRDMESERKRASKDGWRQRYIVEQATGEKTYGDLCGDCMAHAKANKKPRANEARGNGCEGSSRVGSVGSGAVEEG